MPSTMPKRSAAVGLISARTTGRRRVRAMTASMSRSTTQLIVLALPAASVPPTRVSASVHVDGQPRAASIITGTVVTSSSSMMRGLVRATYDRTTANGNRADLTSAVTSAGVVGAALATVTETGYPAPVLGTGAGQAPMGRLDNDPMRRLSGGAIEGAGHDFPRRAGHDFLRRAGHDFPRVERHRRTRGRCHPRSRNGRRGG